MDLYLAHELSGRESTLSLDLCFTRLDFWMTLTANISLLSCEMSS